MTLDDRQDGFVAPGIAAMAACVLCFAAPSPAQAGPWVPKPGDSYLKISGEYFTSNQTYSVAGKRMPAMPAYRHVGSRLYGEVGVAPRLGVGWSLPFLFATNTLEDGRDYNRAGLGDLDVRVDAQIVRDACAVSGSLEGRIPLYGDTVEAGEQATASMKGSGADRYRPILGDGSTELTPSVSFGCGFGPRGWATASTGLNLRFGGFGDGITWSAGGGLYVVPDRFALQIRASGLERFRKRNPRPTKRYVKARAGLMYEVSERVALEGGAGYVLDGAFIARGWAFSLGVSYDGRLFSNPFGAGGER